MIQRSITGARWWMALALGVLSMEGCAGERGVDNEAATGTPVAGGVAVVCLQARVESLNPFVSPDLGAADVRPLLFTPLVRYGGDDDFVPALAVGWSWDDDNRRLQLDLRDDLAWHDGQPVTAADVAWTVRIAANPEYGYLSDDFAGLNRAVAVDSSTVVLEFESPLIAGLEPFVALTVLPRHRLEGLAGEEFQSAEYHRAPVGNGPFRLVERRSDGMIVLERNPDYPEELGRPRLDRLILRTITEPAAIVTELTTGSVDLCVTTATVSEPAQSSPRLTVHTVEPAQTQVLPLDSRHTILGDVRVRRAISAALDRSQLAAAVAPVARPARGPLSERSPWFAPDVGQPDDDPALADSLLAAAGWTGDAAPRRNPEGDELRFTLVAPQGSETSLSVVQEQLRRVGVGVELEFMEWASYVPLLMDPARRPAAMALSFSPEKIIHPESELYAQFHSTGFSNLASYSDPQVDSLLERLLTPIPEAERREITREVQRHAARDVPTLYLVEVPRLTVVGERVRGVEVNLNGPLATAGSWWIPQALRRTR